MIHKLVVFFYKFQTLLQSCNDDRNYSDHISDISQSTTPDAPTNRHALAKSLVPFVSTRLVSRSRFNCVIIVQWIKTLHALAPNCSVVSIGFVKFSTCCASSAHGMGCRLSHVSLPSETFNACFRHNQHPDDDGIGLQMALILQK